MCGGAAGVGGAAVGVDGAAVGVDGAAVGGPALRLPASPWVPRSRPRTTTVAAIRIITATAAVIPPATATVHTGAGTGRVTPVITLGVRHTGVATPATGARAGPTGAATTGDSARCSPSARLGRSGPGLDLFRTRQILGVPVHLQTSEQLNIAVLIAFGCQGSAAFLVGTRELRPLLRELVARSVFVLPAAVRFSPEHLRGNGGIRAAKRAEVEIGDRIRHGHNQLQTE